MRKLKQRSVCRSPARHLQEEFVSWLDVKVHFSQPYKAVTMDSEYQRDGRLMDMIDEKWRSDQLPKEDIQVPVTARPEPDQDNGLSTDNVHEQEQKWLDLALSSLNSMPPTSTQS